MEVCQIVLHCHYIIFGEMSYVLEFWQTADIVLQNVKKVLQCPSMYDCTISKPPVCRILLQTTPVAIGDVLGPTHGSHTFLGAKI